MVGAPDEYEVYRQSKAAFKQWDKDWTNNCLLNKPYYKTKLTDLAGIGKNRGVIAVAYGSSLQPALPYLKELHKHFDIICVEKAFKTLVENGIHPNYVVIADANVNYEQYGKGVDSSKSNLLINACANHDWVKNWQGKIYFYINIDNIGTQHRYMKLSGVTETIPAASNVGNAQIVLCKVALQYSQIFFVGYDYSWKASGLYYGNEQNEDKKFHMNHIKLLDLNEDLVCTSTNLDFSCRWLLTYITRFRLNGINLSGQGLLNHATMNVPMTPTFRQGNIMQLTNALKERRPLVCQN